MLWKLIEADKIPMGGKLTAAEKQALKAYIEQGRFPVEEVNAAEQAREAAKITPEARNWWSFRKPVKSAAPAVKNKDQAPTPIDAFVLAKLEENRPHRVAACAPEVKAFLEDKSANAYEKVIDRLLASHRYGEHWGRHWLDVAGYSDSRGDAGDTDREVSWKYRDYVINAFNRNKPINQFILEQVAGDQLVNYKPGERPAPEHVEPLTATGFLRTTADITDNQTIYGNPRTSDRSTGGQLISALR